MTSREEKQVTPVQLRKQAKLTQLQVAYALGVRPETISDWERGRYAPSILFVRPLSQLYQCSADELVSAFDNLHSPKTNSTNS